MCGGQSLTIMVKPLYQFIIIKKNILDIYYCAILQSNKNEVLASFDASIPIVIGTVPFTNVSNKMEESECSF